MRGLLDDAAGESGPCGAALPQSSRGPRNAHPVYDSGSCYGEGLSGAALPRGGDGHHNAALVPHVALPLGQIGQSHSGVDLPPALLVSLLLASVLLLLLPVNVLEKQL